MVPASVQCAPFHMIFFKHYFIYSSSKNSSLAITCTYLLWQLICTCLFSLQSMFCKMKYLGCYLRDLWQQSPVAPFFVLFGTSGVGGIFGASGRPYTCEAVNVHLWWTLFLWNPAAVTLSNCSSIFLGKQLKRWNLRRGRVQRSTMWIHLLQFGMNWHRLDNILI